MEDKAIHGGELCLEEMERDRLEEAWEGGAEWVAIGRAQAPPEAASAQAVGKRLPTSGVRRVIASAVPSAGREW